MQGKTERPENVALYEKEFQKNAKDLFPYVEEIEKRILGQLVEEGYGINQIYTSLGESRMQYLEPDDGAREAYFERLLETVEKRAGKANAEGKMDVRGRFNELFEAQPEAHRAFFEKKDLAALKALEKRLPQDEIREAYLDASLYRRFAKERSAASLERGLWKDYKAARREQAEKESVVYADDYRRAWEEWGSQEALPLAYREGSALAAFLRKTGASEETCEELLKKYSAYEGRDRAAYLRKLVREAEKEKLAYDALKKPAPDNIYQISLAVAKEKQLEKTFTLTDEAQIAAIILGTLPGATAAKLSPLVLAASPNLQAPGLDKDNALGKILGTGERGTLPYKKGEYVSYEDVYRRLMVEYDEALIQRGEWKSIDYDRLAYNRKAARELFREGATEEEVQDILERIGGLRKEERTPERLKELLAEARQEEGEAVNPITAAEIHAEKTRREEPPVRSLVREEREDPRQEEREAAPAPEEETAPKRERQGPPRHLSRAQSKAIYARIPLFEPRTKGEEDMTAEDFYQKTAEEYKEAFPIPYNDAMDEQVMLHMLAQGYREEDIMSAVAMLSEAPSNLRQKNYAQGKMANMKKNPKYKDKWKGFKQNLVSAERTYEQAQHNAGKKATEYDEAIIRRRDPVGIPQ